MTDERSGAQITTAAAQLHAQPGQGPRRQAASVMTGFARPSPAAGLVRRFYDELWNAGRLVVADEILAENIAFHGTLGPQLSGRDAVKNHVAQVRAAFPDWLTRIDEMVEAGNRIATRMTWTGTHLGRLGLIEPTGRT